MRESTRGAWAGDEDLGDGKLQQLHNQYTSDCSLVKKISAKPCSQLTIEELQKLDEMVKGYLEFLTAVELCAKDAYEKVLQASRPSENTLMELSWNLIGFEELLKQNSEFSQEITQVVNKHVSGQQQFVKSAIVKLSPRLLNYVKEVYTKKRSAATHLMIFMISDESRNTKPYAVPVRFLPYHSITDNKLRQLQMEIEDAMIDLNMIPVGKYS